MIKKLKPYLQRLFFVGMVLFTAQLSFAQFSDTIELKRYINDTLKDRRPDKITSVQIQKAFLGMTKFIGGVGNIYKRRDSVFAVRNNAETFIYKDSSGGTIAVANGITVETNVTKLGGPLTKPTRIYDSTGANEIIIANNGGNINPTNKNAGGYLRIGPSISQFGYRYKGQNEIDNLVGMRTIPAAKGIDFGINGNAMSIDSLAKLTLPSYKNNNAGDSILTTDVNGKVKQILKPVGSKTSVKSAGDSTSFTIGTPETNYIIQAIGVIGNSTAVAANNSNGTAPPNTIPAAISLIYVNTSTKKVYVSTGTSSVSDWTILNP